MKPIEWLRAKAAAAVRIGPGPLGEPTQADVKRVAAIVEEVLERRAPLLGIGYEPPTPAQTDRLVQQLRTDVREPAARPSVPLRCPCVAIYSECRCPGTNISAQTNTADFHAEHQ